MSAPRWFQQRSRLARAEPRTACDKRFRVPEASVMNPGRKIYYFSESIPIPSDSNAVVIQILFDSLFEPRLLGCFGIDEIGTNRLPFSI